MNGIVEDVALLPFNIALLNTHNIKDFLCISSYHQYSLICRLYRVLFFYLFFKQYLGELCKVNLFI